MKNLEKASIIRRTVENKAYHLLKDCKEPEKAYDGDWFMREFWDVDFLDLHYEVVIELDKTLDFEEGDFVDRQIEFHCQNFLESNDYEKMREQLAEEYYQAEAERRDLEVTNRAHMPTWRP